MAVEKKEQSKGAKVMITPKDTGSSQSQIIILSQRISALTEHLKKHRKDYATKRALLNLAGKRKRMLKYYGKQDALACREVCQQLSIRYNT